VNCLWTCQPQGVPSKHFPAQRIQS
jgi:hypothetical protein